MPAACDVCEEVSDRPHFHIFLKQGKGARHIWACEACVQERGLHPAEHEDY